MCEFQSDDSTFSKLELALRRDRENYEILEFEIEPNIIVEYNEKEKMA
ncbi:MAG: hypothetical protein R2771_09565 [Saprospiraceae bacterium]